MEMDSYGRFSVLLDRQVLYLGIRSDLTLPNCLKIWTRDSLTQLGVSLFSVLGSDGDGAVRNYHRHWWNYRCFCYLKLDSY